MNFSCVDIHEEKLKIKGHVVFMNRLIMHICKKKNGQTLQELFSKNLLNACFAPSPGHLQ